MASSSSSAAPPPVPRSPPWVMLSRVARVERDAVEDPRDLSLALDAPPRFSRLTVPTSAHPDPTRDGADRHPYVLAAANDGAGLLLFHVSRAPSSGFNLGHNPPGVLVVARGFQLPLASGGGSAATTATGTAVRVPDRAPPEQPRVSTVRSVGLLPVPGTGGAEFVVAELQVASRSRLLTFRSGADFWDEQPLACPLVSGTCENWTPHDVIAHDGHLWWADLAQGLLGCNPLERNPGLRYAELPEMFSLKDRAEPLRQIDNHRVVRVSDGRVRFVDVARKRGDKPEKALVVVWTLVLDPSGKDLSGRWPWQRQSATSLEKIWASDSYKARRMPEEVPVLAFVHPDKPDVVYFFLEDYVFAVDVRDSAVVECARARVQVSAGPQVISWRHVLAWVLPPSLHNALGDENHSSEESQENKDLAPAEGCQPSSAPPSEATDKNEST